MQQAPMKGFSKPIPKEILNSGLVIIRENIAEDATNPNQTVYTWLETRYSQLEYMHILEQEKDLLKTQVNTQEEIINQQQIVMDELLFEIIPGLVGNGGEVL